MPVDTAEATRSGKSPTAVPVAATLRLVLIYVRAKLRDEDPFGPLSEELATVTDSAGETATEAAGVRSGVRAHP